MTLNDVASKTMKVLEEYEATGTFSTTDTDYQNKFCVAYNNIANEIAKVYGIKATKEFSEALNLESEKIKNVIEVKQDGECYYGWYLENGYLKTNDSGTFVLYYDKQPDILADADDVVEFPEHIVNIMVYGIARLILIGADEYNKANEFENKYYQLVQEIPKTSGLTKVKVRGYGIK